MTFVDFLPEPAANSPSARAGRAPSLHGLFRASLERRPEAVALSTDAEHWSYQALAAAAEEVARRLLAAGAPPEAIAVLALERSAEGVAALLGALLAGSAFCPLDPALPARRQAKIFEDLTGSGGRPIVLSRARYHLELPPGWPRLDLPPLAALAREGARCQGDAPTRDLGPEALAYVLFTSGSTGRPKGVMVPHRGAAAVAAHFGALAARAPEPRGLQAASLSFDASVFEIFVTFAAGGRLVLAEPGLAASGARFTAALERHAVSFAFATPTVWEGVEPRTLGELRLVVLGGERLPGRLAERWRRPGLELVNGYGPTEGSMCATAAVVGAEGTSGGEPPIGYPLPGTGVYLLGPEGDQAGEGEPGEIAIGAPLAARGYLGRPAATADRFRPDPWSGIPGARLYRTGDLGRRLPGGELHFEGRRDGQVKVRGLRVELGEVEAALAEHPALGEVAAAACQSHLLAAFVARPGEAPPEAEALRRFLAERLPESLVPARFLALPALPRTENGKTDRQALAHLALDREASGQGYVAPEGELETRVAELFAELLGLERVGAEDGFFLLGGHSLLATRLLARLRQELGVEVPIAELLGGASTVRAVAGLVARQRERAGAGAELLPALTRAPEAESYPTSFPQETVWFLDRLSPGNRAYHACAALRFRGQLQMAALGRALDLLVARHESFRSAFPEWQGRPRLVIHPHRPAWRLPLLDLSGLAPEDAERAQENAYARETRRPFCLTEPPLVRWRLLRRSADDHRLLQVEHHLVHDGWSFALLVADLVRLYPALAEGRNPAVTEPPFRFRDFAVWQRAQAGSERWAAELAYWRQQLAGLPPVLELPADRPRPREQSFAGRAFRSDVPVPLQAPLRALARRLGTTLYGLLTAAFNALLARTTGRRDVAFGSGMANRRLAELEDVIGMMVNTVVLRTRFAGDPSFAELVAETRQVLAAASAHQDLPFELLVAELAPERSLAWNPLVQVLFSCHDSAVPELAMAGLELEVALAHNGSAKADLNIVVVPRAEQRVGRAPDAADEELFLQWEHSTDLFDPATVERLAGHYLELLASAVAGPEQPLSALCLLGPAERRQLAAWSQGGGETPAEATLPRLLQEQLTLRPDAVAVVAEDGHLSYGELLRLGRSLAGELRQRGLGLEGRVAVALPRSLELAVALVGVLEAGGAYLPLDPTYPEERLRRMTAEHGAALALLPAGGGDSLPPSVLPGRRLEVDLGRLAHCCPAAPSPALPESLAYVLFTSGSTGEPKAVGVPHRAIARLVVTGGFAAMGPAERWLQFAPLSFDASTLELWAPLARGGRLVMMPSGAVSLEELGRVVARHQLSALWLTTSLARQVAAGSLADYASLGQWLVGGEAVPAELASSVLERLPGCRLVNGYGPTESTTFSHTFAMDSPAEVRDPLPIGRPIGATRGLVLGSRFALQPIGVPGELFLGGAGLARGYLGRPAATAEKFRPDPHAATPGERLYATGDRVRWRPDGVVEYLGRLDRQVKIRGFRIEPGEIESQLQSLPGVSAAAVKMLDDPLAGKRLAAYVCGQEGLSSEGLKAELGARLPQHLVPSFVVVLERLPLGATGKVDLTALPHPEPTTGPGEQLEPPRGPLEEALAGLWSELLGVRDVGRQDDFFALGGHSLLATQLVSRLRLGFGVELPLAAVFERSVLAELAAELAVRGAGTAAPEATPSPAVAAADLRPDLDGLSDGAVEALLAELLAAEEA